MGTLAFLIGSIVSALVAGGVGIYSAAKNYKAQQQANQTNVQMMQETNSANIAAVQATNEANLQAVRETNAQQMDLAKHAHQYEMEDLKAAGLNPVLTATGGNGASVGALNVPTQRAPQMQAPQVNAVNTNLSGVTSALNAMTSALAMGMIASGRNATSIANNNSRNEVLNGLYRRKAEALGRHAEASAVVNTPKQLHEAAKRVKTMTREQILRELDAQERAHSRKYGKDELPF